MKTVYCVYEDSHGMVGLATDYHSAIDGLIKEKWLDGNIEMLDDNDSPSTIKEIFGDEWVSLIKQWDISTFNDYFDGIFWIGSREIWGS